MTAPSATLPVDTLVEQSLTPVMLEDEPGAMEALNTLRDRLKRALLAVDAAQARLKQAYRRFLFFSFSCDRLRHDSILIDGEGVVEGGMTKLLLQRFSKTVIGPILFEFIERKGYKGFGEGNFRALFESIEEDQIRRGVLKDTAA